MITGNDRYIRGKTLKPIELILNYRNMHAFAYGCHIEMEKKILNDVEKPRLFCFTLFV